MRAHKVAHALALAAGLSGASTLAMAAGTAPGVTVTNSVDITYTTGGSTITRVNEDEVSFVIDRKVDFTIEGEDASKTVQVAQGSQGQQQTYRLVNQGNDLSGFDIDVAISGPAFLTYDPSGAGMQGNYSVYIGPTSDPVSGADTLYDVTGTVSIGDIDPDQEVFIKIVAGFPTSALDGDTETFVVSATALDPGTSTVTVDSTNPTLTGVDTFLSDTDADGVESDMEDFVVVAPMLSATKTSTLISENIDGSFDCANGSLDATAEAFVPGACVEYTLHVENASDAGQAADGLMLTDVLPFDVTFVNVVSNTGFDSVTETNGTITASLASLAPGASADLKFRVTID